MNNNIGLRYPSSDKMSGLPPSSGVHCTIRLISALDVSWHQHGQRFYCIFPAASNIKIDKYFTKCWPSCGACRMEFECLATCASTLTLTVIQFLGFMGLLVHTAHGISPCNSEPGSIGDLRAAKLVGQRGHSICLPLSG
jgi:hypothetical protein